MNFNHDKSWDCLSKLLRSALPANEAWTKLIEFHEKNAPKTYWTGLKNLDLVSEQAATQAWLQEIVTRAPLPANVVALWIGLVKFKQEENEKYAIYLGGTDTYLKDDIDWDERLTYLPEDRYAVPGNLNTILDTVKNDKTDFEFLDWILPLGYCAFMLDESIRNTLDKKLFLQHQSALLFACGHDNGDYLDLSPLK